MVALLWLRRKEPNMARPFRVPLYPVLPLVALAIALVSIVAMTFFNSHLALIYFLFMIASYCLFKLLKKKAGVIPDR
jgi:ethanolamine permease